MAVVRSNALFSVLATVCVIAMCAGPLTDLTSLPTFIRGEHAPSTPCAYSDCQDDALEEHAFGTPSGESSQFLRMPTEQVLREYYTETLSVIPAIMFAPAALQLSFAQTIDLPIDEHGNTLLHVASRSGDVFAVWQLLEMGANPDLVNRFHEFPVDIVYTANTQVSQSLKAAFLADRDAISDVLFRRPGWTASAAPATSSARSTRGSAGSTTGSAGSPAGTTRPTGLTMGVVTPSFHSGFDKTTGRLTTAPGET